MQVGGMGQDETKGRGKYSHSCGGRAGKRDQKQQSLSPLLETVYMHGKIY